MNRLLNKKWLLLVIIPFLIYLPSLWNKFVWDDEQFIYKNDYVKEFRLKEILTSNTIAGAGHSSNYYRPVTTLSFALDHAFWGLNPIGFHLTNALLHIGAGLLLFYILQKLSFKKNQAFLLSLIFLLHPLQTEAVVYANSRGDSMYTFWAFFSLWTWLQALEQKVFSKKIYNRQITISRFTWLFLSSVSYLLAIFSKEIGIATLGLHGLSWLFIYFQNNYQLINQQKLKKMAWPLVGLAANLIIAISYLYLRATNLNFVNSFDFYGGDNLYSQNLGFRLLIFSKILLTYFKLLIIPYPLHMERDSEIIESIFNPWPILAILIIVLLIGLAWLEWHKKKNLQQSTKIWFGLLWFAIMISPVAGIVPINGLIYEHWLYTPMIGFFIILLGLWELSKIKISQTAKQIFCFTIFMSFGILTIRQNWLWAEPIRFYEYTLRYNQSARLYNNLAMSYADQQNYDKAIENYQLSLKLYDQYPQTYHNLGNIYQTLGDNEQAIDYYEQALAIQPEFLFTYSPLTKLYLATQQWPKAEQLLKQLLKIFPEDPQIAYSLGQVLAKQQKNDEAKKIFTQILAITARNSSLHQQATQQIEQLPK